MLVVTVSMGVQIGGMPLRLIPVTASIVTMTAASFVYLPVVVNGGVGKNGSTIAVSVVVLCRRGRYTAKVSAHKSL